MIKQLLIGVAACALMASPRAFAQSSSDDWEAAARTTGATHGQAYDDANIVKTEPINLGQTVVASTIDPMEVQVPEAALERLAGRYTAQDKSVIVVTRAGNRLAADLAGISLEFAPSGPNEFFVQGGPLTLSFAANAAAPGDAGKAQGLVVKENGMAIIQATASR